MKRFALSVLFGAFFLLFIFGRSGLAQAQTSGQPTTQDPQAVSLALQSLNAMTRGNPISDATLSGTATRIAGSDEQTGTVTIQVKGTQESRIALALSGGTYSEIRNFAEGASQGSSTGPDGVAKTMAFHNCFTDAAWFFPALSSLGSAVSNPNFVISYIGPETHAGVAVQHIRFSQSIVSPDSFSVQLIAHLSTIDFYLDSTSLLPVAVAFTTHPGDNGSLDIGVEVRFSNYQVSSGVLVPLHIQRLINGNLYLDLNASSVVLNSGLSDNIFQVQ
jgi:hypothetical protein